MNRALIDYTPETEFAAGVAAPPRDGSGTRVFSEAQELELAMGLLESAQEVGLERFIAQLAERAGKALGSPLQAPVSHALVGTLGRVIRSALPPSLRSGSASPITGSTPTNLLKRTASQLFGLELEGLSPEDQEFEFARGVVRFAAEAVRNAAAAGGTPPRAAALKAVAQAARRFAPGVLNILATHPGVASVPSSIAEPSLKENAMHDIDRTQMEFAPELSGFQSEQFEFGETEQEWSGEFAGETTLGEAQEMQLASELLEVSTEAELDRFLGDFIKKVGSVAGKVIRSPVGQAIGGVLKGVAKKALPLAGGAIGGYFGGPLGAKIGSGLASAAGGALGLEAESYEQEDRELEGAKQFVRIAADTVNKAASAAPNADPRAVAQAAAIAAARRFAPGLVGGGTGTALSAPGGGVAAGSRSRNTGRWMRRGTKIVLFGV